MNDNTRKEIDFTNCLVLPYVRHLEASQSDLKKIDKKLIFKYNDKLSKLLCNNKISSSCKESGVYRIECNDCNKQYVGETGRELKQRIKEHKRDIRKNKIGSAIAQHVNQTLHDINFDSAKLVYPCNNIKKRRIVESALITSNTNCMNLNKGFSPLNSIISISICDNLKLNLN